MPDMRYAPPPAMRVADRGGGLNQTSVRTLNERLVMSLLRQHDQLSRMELVQLSGLSAQTVSVIVRALERDNMILRGEALRGRVGPPSIPMSLNPDGAFAIGVKVGVKSIDTVVLDYTGQVRHHLERSYEHPTLDGVLGALSEDVPAAIETLPAAMRGRIVGAGLSLPEDVEDWPLPAWQTATSEGWATVDFEERLGAIVGLPVHIQDDVTAAAGAELMFGAARKLDDFAYLYIGARSANRLVLNHRIYAGRDGGIAGGTPIGSLTDLETVIRADGGNPAWVWGGVDAWPEDGPATDAWVRTVAESLADAINALSAFVRIETALVGGRLPERTLAATCTLLEELLEARFGEEKPRILAGATGALAKAVGSAGLPFHSRFMVDDVGLASAGR